jgi:hypothetical protein
MNAAKIKDEIRYMSRNDKVEIYRWLDGELAGDLPSRIGSRRSIAIRREIERAWRVEVSTRLKRAGSPDRYPDGECGDDHDDRAALVP